MIFSKACEYGIRSAIYIAQRSLNNERCNLKDISKEVGSPEAFTAKILQLLVKGNIVKSVKGPSGGFEVSVKELKKIKLIDIVLAIDGEIDEKKCVLGLKKCSEDHPCPVHSIYKHIKKDLLSMVHNTSLSEMSNSVEAGLTCLKI